MIFYVGLGVIIMGVVVIVRALRELMSLRSFDSTEAQRTSNSRADGNRNRTNANQASAPRSWLPHRVIAQSGYIYPESTTSQHSYVRDQFITSLR